MTELEEILESINHDVEKCEKLFKELGIPLDETGKEAHELIKARLSRSNTQQL